MIASCFFAVWEAPQNALGFLFLVLNRINGAVVDCSRERRRMFIRLRNGAVSLGYFVFWSMESNDIFYLDENNKFHEYGHSIQSRIFGPLYLLIIGLPSVFRVLYARRYFKKYKTRWPGYYAGFPENWADRLGNVHSINA